MLEHLDFLFSINVAAREGLGEDSWCYAFSQGSGMIAALDGCGGSGARKHEYYTGHSEAYVASRLGAGALYDAFNKVLDERGTAAEPEEILERFSRYCRDSFAAYRPPAAQKSKIRTSMVTTLPTTLAAAFLREQKGRVEVTEAWAGDSRVYALTPEGLAQLTMDDSDPPDPFVTDGTMTNTLRADREPRIHRSSQAIALPAILFAATDGCFAYFTTPMEFEGALEQALLASASAAEWEQRLRDQFYKVAGDDFTMVTAVMGFGSFSGLKQSFASRFQFLRERFLRPIAALSPDDIAGRRRLWDDYRENYMRYIKD